MKYKAITLTLLSLLSPTGYADLLGVEDAALINQSIEQVSALYKQLEVLQRSYNKAQEQLNATQSMLAKADTQIKSMENLSHANSGHYGFGRLENILKDQQWSPDSWSDALNGVTTDAKYKSLLDAYQKSHPSTDLANGLAGSAVHDYKRAAAINKASAVQSEYALDDINKSLKRIHTLSLEIEKADNTKAAVDLNSRLLAEIAYLQTQNLKAQSIVNQQLAEAQALSLRDAKNKSQYLAFNDDY
ncbi:MAG: hypothetical protein CMJ94_02950 [Planctomycetes bacterium]|nr:hypothetical protein [Planctomycetota bacterium]